MVAPFIEQPKRCLEYPSLVLVLCWYCAISTRQWTVSSILLLTGEIQSSAWCPSAGAAADLMVHSDDVESNETASAVAENDGTLCGHETLEELLAAHLPPAKLQVTQSQHVNRSIYP